MGDTDALVLAGSGRVFGDSNRGCGGDVVLHCVGAARFDGAGRVRPHARRARTKRAEMSSGAA